MALSENVNIDEKEGVLVAHPMAVDIIYKGALVMHNAAGFLAPCAAEAGAVFAGVAYEKQDNSAGSAGDLKCRAIKKGRFLLPSSGLAQTDVGLPVYASDDSAVTKTYAAGLVLVGYIDEYVSATECYVKIDVAADAGQKALSRFAIVYAGEHTTVGGDANEAISQAGILATDIVHVTLHTVGAVPRTILTSQAAADVINVVMSGDPSTDHVLSYSVLRAL